MSIYRIQDSVYVSKVNTSKKKSKVASETDSFAPVDAAFMEILGHEAEQKKQEAETEEERKEKEREQLAQQWEIAQSKIGRIKDKYKGNNIDWIG